MNYMKKKTTNLCKEVDTKQVAIFEYIPPLSDEELKILSQKVDDEKLRRRNLKIVAENKETEKQYALLLSNVDNLLEFTVKHHKDCYVTPEQESEQNRLSFDYWMSDEYSCQYEKDMDNNLCAKCIRCALLSLKQNKYNENYIAQIKIIKKDLLPLLN